MIQAVLLSATEYEAIISRITTLEKRIELAEEHALEWVSVKQARVFLSCSRNTVYALIERGEIIKSQDGKKIEISLKSIREYKLKHTVS